MIKKIVFSILLVLLFITALSGCGIFHWRGKIPDYKEQSYTCLDSPEIHDIVIDNDDIPVELHISENEDIHFSYYLADDESNQYEILENDGVLNVSNKSKPNYGIFIFGDEYTSDSYKDVRLELFIPYDYPGNVSIQTLDGNIRIYDISIEGLDIETSDGDIVFENTNIIGHLYCKTRDGDIKGTLAGKLSDYNFKTISSDNESTLNSSDKSSKTVEFITNDGDMDVSFR